MITAELYCLTGYKETSQPAEFAVLVFDDGFVIETHTFAQLAAAKKLLRKIEAPAAKKTARRK